MTITTASVLAHAVTDILPVGTGSARREGITQRVGAFVALLSDAIIVWARYYAIAAHESGKDVN
jgi:hypothetical protein